MSESSIDAARLGVTSAAISGDSGTLYQIAGGLLEDGVPFETVLFDVLVPVERDIGHRWQQGDYLVPEEHAATAALETVISLLAGSFDHEDGAASVVVAGAEGDLHSLPGRAVAADLASRGYRCVLLGPDVLAADLTEYLDSERPAAMVLSCAMAPLLVGARESIRAGHAAGVPVLAGGDGFGEGGRWAPAVGADAWAGELRDVAHILSSWDPDPEEAERGVARPSPALDVVQRARPSIVAGAYRALDDAGPVGPRRIQSELELLLDGVMASLLVSSPEIASATATWQRNMLSARGYGRPGALADALRSALAEAGAPEAAEMLEPGS